MSKWLILDLGTSILSATLHTDQEPQKSKGPWKSSKDRAMENKIPILHMMGPQALFKSLSIEVKLGGWPPSQLNKVVVYNNIRIVL